MNEHLITNFQFPPAQEWDTSHKGIREKCKIIRGLWYNCVSAKWYAIDAERDVKSVWISTTSCTRSLHAASRSRLQLSLGQVLLFGSICGSAWQRVMCLASEQTRTRIMSAVTIRCIGYALMASSLIRRMR